MSSNTVWLSQFGDLGFVNIYAIDADFPKLEDAVELFKLENKQDRNNVEHEKYSIMLTKSVELKKKWFKCEYLDIENMPSKIYSKPPRELPHSNDIIFQITNGYLIFNQACYDIIVKHNLGKTHFSQVFIYDIETQEQLSDIPYYFINVAETMELVNVAESKGIVANEYSPEMPDRFIDNPKDNDIILEKTANDNNLDIWHDPRLDESLFLSDSLVQELLNAGISTKALGLVSCQIR